MSLDVSCLLLRSCHGEGVFLVAEILRRIPTSIPFKLCPIKPIRHSRETWSICRRFAYPTMAIVTCCPMDQGSEPPRLGSLLLSWKVPPEAGIWPIMTHQYAGGRNTRNIWGDERWLTSSSRNGHTWKATNYRVSESGIRIVWNHGAGWSKICPGLILVASNPAKPEAWHGSAKSRNCFQKRNDLELVWWWSPVFFLSDRVPDPQLLYWIIAKCRRIVELHTSFFLVSSSM